MQKLASSTIEFMVSEASVHLEKKNVSTTKLDRGLLPSVIPDLRA